MTEHVFLDSGACKSLLDVSESHLKLVRVLSDGTVIGQDSVDNLKVSTVFAAMAIETALNDYLVCHCLFIKEPYLQQVFKTVMSKYLKCSVREKLKLLQECWLPKIPKEKFKGVRKLFEIRNRVVHETPEFVHAFESEDGEALVSDMKWDQDTFDHMKKHYSIAVEFLSSFGLPCNRLLEDWKKEEERTNS